MRPFEYDRAKDAAIAVETAVSGRGQFLAGGTNLADYMKLGVTQAETLVDINPLGANGHGTIETSEEGLRIGALVRMADAEDHDGIRRDYPVIADTLKLAASRQIRTMATLGGNLLQRTRCEYFRGRSWLCNRRVPGSGCAAREGINREHAILGVSDHCIAAYPGDFAQAMVALDATLEIRGPDGDRTLPVTDLHCLPGDTPARETVLNPGELIAFIRVPAGPHTRRSRFLKIRDRDSYQFAQASAAVALDLDGDRVRDVRIALGGVATVPWRAREAEDVLRGETLDADSAGKAAEAAFSGAKPHEHNAFKLPLGKETLKRALRETAEMEI